MITLLFSRIKSTRYSLILLKPNKNNNNNNNTNNNNNNNNIMITKNAIQLNPDNDTVWDKSHLSFMEKKLAYSN